MISPRPELRLHLHPAIKVVWRRVRVVEGARLESVYTGNCIESSNLSVSAESLFKSAIAARWRILF